MTEFVTGAVLSVTVYVALAPSATLVSPLKLMVVVSGVNVSSLIVPVAVTPPIVNVVVSVGSANTSSMLL